MLSGETAVGRHPLASLRMMDRIVRAAENADPPRCPSPAPDVNRATPVAAVTHAGRVLADAIDAVAIAAVTRTGRTAQLLSQERARLPVYAFTPDVAVCRRLALVARDRTGPSAARDPGNTQRRVDGQTSGAHRRRATRRPSGSGRYARRDQRKLTGCGGAFGLWLRRPLTLRALARSTSRSSPH